SRATNARGGAESLRAPPRERDPERDEARRGGDRRERLQRIAAPVVQLEVERRVIARADDAEKALVVDAQQRRRKRRERAPGEDRERRRRERAPRARVHAQRSERARADREHQRAGGGQRERPDRAPAA